MRKIKNYISRAVFVGPAFLIFVIFMIIPIFMSFRYSFYKWDGVSNKIFAGLFQFEKMAHDQILIKSIMNSLKLTFWAVSIQLPLGLIFAVLLSYKLKFKKLFQTVYFMPVILSTAVLGILWTQIYDPNIGLINQFFILIGHKEWAQVWLGDLDLAFGSIVAVVSWQFIGFYMLVYYSALQNIPEELNEAARIDGASEWYQIIKIRIPLIWHVISFTIIYAVVNSLKYFDLIYIMTDGGPNHSSEVIASYMMKQAFRFFDFGYASAIAVLLCLLGVFLAIVLNRVFKRDVIQY